MHDNPPTPNRERPPHGGPVTPSRAARHTQPPSGEYPYSQGQQPLPDGSAPGGYPTGSYPTGSFPTGPFAPAGQPDPRLRRPGGYPGNGATPNGAQNGYQNGYGPATQRPREHSPASGYQTNGYAPNGHQTNGNARSGPAPNGYAPNGHTPGGHPQRVVPSRAARHAPARRPGGYPQPQGVAPSRAARYGRAPATASRQARHARQRQRQRSFWTELPVLVIAAFVLAIGVKGFVVQAFYIPSGSMQPTLQVNDRVLVNRLAYGGDAIPAHGDVVVFVREIPGAPPPDPTAFGAVQRAVAQGLGNAPPGSEDLIKRVIGRPGDVLEGRDGHLWRNGQPVDESYLPPGTITDDFGPVTIAPGHMWVMGDNRDNSADSRAFGQVPVNDLVGRAMVLVWPFDHVGGL